MVKEKAKQIKVQEIKVKDLKGREIEWLPYVAEQNYPNAQSYLSLLYGQERVDGLISALKAAAVVRFQAKDIFRASQLSLLGVSNSHVEKDRKRIQRGESLSPLLLVRDEANGKVVIADGYHRLCSVYFFDEDAWIPGKIV
jgi:disulfide oxidoreductase YuzD